MTDDYLTEAGDRFQLEDAQGVLILESSSLPAPVSTSWLASFLLPILSALRMVWHSI